MTTITPVLTGDVLALAQDLIRRDSSTPEGIRACALLLRDVLEDAGIATVLRGPDPQRPNLVARLPGAGRAAPLLLQGHLDVVPVTGQAWSRDPFGAEVVDGQLFGRGAVDMKGQLAMMISALVRFTAEGTRPAGDVVLAAVCDEETGGRAGAHALVTDHRELFDGVRYAIGEDGGAYADLGTGADLHPIAVSEKRAAWTRLTLRGPGTHGSLPPVGTTAATLLRRTLGALGDGLLERQVTPAARLMVERMAIAVPELAEQLLAFLEGGPVPPVPAAPYLLAALHHTAVPTAVVGPSVTNLVPSTITVDIDGRLLPGAAGTGDMIRMLRHRLREAGVGDVPIEVLVEGEPLPEPDLGPFFGRLTELAQEADPGAVALPMISTASTDARLFAQLGISCYGWFPAPGSARHRVRLHQVDESLPVAALATGAAAYHELLREHP